MSDDFEKHAMPDFGRKLAHLEGILGAYLPKRVFSSAVQQKCIDCTKSTFTRICSGQRKVANWELGRFVELFELGRHGFDYRLFLLSFEEFDAALRSRGVGSFGVSARFRLRELLRSHVDSSSPIRIMRDRRLNVGGIGGTETEDGIMCLTAWHSVSLTIPLELAAGESAYMLLLHDFPDGRATSCLMPSSYAPEHRVSTQTLRLPQPSSGFLSFPVHGVSGYRCLYGIQSKTDLAAYVGLQGATDMVADIDNHQIAMLVDFLGNVSAHERAQTRVTFTEYILKAMAGR